MRARKKSPTSSLASLVSKLKECLFYPLEPHVLESVKQTQFHGFSPDLYKSFNPHPPNLPSNTRDSHFGIGNPLFKKFQVNTSNKANFTGPPENYKKVTIDPNVRDRLSQAHWEIGTPSTGPVLNTTTVLSF